MAPALGLDFMSTVAIGAAGAVASAALYVFSGSKEEAKEQPNKTKSTKAPVAVAPVQHAPLEATDDTKQLTKKQRQKLNKQKKREEAPTTNAVSSPVMSGPDSDGPATTEKPKKKKNKKKAKSKKQEVTESNDKTPSFATLQEDDIEPVTDEDGELAFALALAGNQKNMQQMRSGQKLKQQKEQDRDQRRKQAEELQRREEAKKEEEAQAAIIAAAALAAGEPKQETTVIAVKAREVQIILGQGGKVIKQIRAESGARLDVSKRDEEGNGGKERRLLTIVGTHEQIDKARTQLRTIFKEENAKSQVVTVGDKMAAVIGKGGSVIKRIKEETGATLDADREAGTIRVSGEPEQIEQAVVAINKIAAPGDEITMKLSKRQKMLVIGKGGTMIRKIEEMTQCQLDVEKTEDGGGVLKIGGDSAQVLEAMKTIQQLFHEASFTVTVVCGDLIGAIIGKGGEVIRKIQEDTQVKLDIEMEKKSVVIVGYEKDVLKAQEKIQSILACPVEIKAGETKLHVDLGAYVSSVIGRGGAKVREIEESSGAVVKVLGTDCIIVGKQSKVEAAKRLIDEILKKQVEASIRNEAAMAAVQALSESHTQRNTANPQGDIPWGASAWGNDLAHWTASPVVR